jgi:hypothetical protein
MSKKYLFYFSFVLLFDKFLMADVNVTSSVFAIIQKAKLQKQANGSYIVKNPDSFSLIDKVLTFETPFYFPKRALFNPNSKYKNELVHLAHCSSALVDKDILATASHCFSPGSKICGDYYFIQNYVTSKTTFYSNEVFTCKEHFSFAALDSTLVQLNKKPHATPFIIPNLTSYKKYDNVQAYGFPHGISMRVSTGKLIKKGYENKPHLAQLPIIGGSSGGPLILKGTNKLIGIASYIEYHQMNIKKVFPYKTVHCQNIKKLPCFDLNFANDANFKTVELIDLLLKSARKKEIFP